MRNILMGMIVAATAMAGCATAQTGSAGAGGGAAVAALADDPARPPADVARDAKRKPAEMLAFAGIKPGMVVVDLIPGGGYFTRIFSKAVGPTGKVYAASGPGRDGGPPAVNAVISNAAYSNVTLAPLTPATQTFTLPEKADVVWTSRNYHDLRNPSRNLDINVVTKGVFDALKPGGIFIVLDHSTAATGPEVPGTLHRISAEVVKADMKAAGFQFVGESNALRNPADDTTKRVNESGALPDGSDQFILKFRKP
jgi:predicted methyltransferase